MSSKITSKVLTTFLGSNTLARQIIRREFLKGKRFRAMAMMLCFAPFRDNIYPDKIIREETFLASSEYYAELQDLLRFAKVDDFELVRTGRDHDGGYIMLNDFHEGGIAYSFGICDDVSWDKDMASRGYDIFMYDHTIEKLPEENSRFHWSKLGIADGITQDERLKTLEYLISQNHHEDKRSMILKMDVEGAEWGFLSSVNSEVLQKFDQMTFEFHSMTNPDNPELVLEVFRKINRTHQLIHIHANNCAGYVSIGSKKFPRTIELSYALREKYNFLDADDINLPLEIDAPNSVITPEIELGQWNKKAKIDNRFTAAIITI